MQTAEFTIKVPLYMFIRGITYGIRFFIKMLYNDKHVGVHLYINSHDYRLTYKEPKAEP